MLILKPISICICSLIIILLMRNICPEFVPYAAIISGIILIMYSLPYLKSIFGLISNMEYLHTNISSAIKLCIKVVVVSLLCEFTTQLCNDSGEKYLSSKIDFVGRIIILGIISPTIIQFIENIIAMVNTL